MGHALRSASLRVDFNFSTPDPHAYGTSGRIPWYLRNADMNRIRGSLVKVG